MHALMVQGTGPDMGNRLLAAGQCRLSRAGGVAFIYSTVLGRFGW
jgi:cobyric acid synthase